MAWSPPEDAEMSDVESPEEILEESAGTATVNGDVVNEDADTDAVEPDSDDAQAGCKASEDDETVQYGNIPSELTEDDRWVCWRTEERDGKPTKIPVDAGQGGNAAADDPDTWTSYDEAREYAEHPDTPADGVGFVFTADGRFCGVDLDDCVNPETGDVSSWARDIVTTLDSYTERSPSGTGLHVIVEGELPEGGNRCGDVELYDRGRYFTVTGDVGANGKTEIEERTSELEAVHREYVESSSDVSDVAEDQDTPGTSQTSLDDEDVIEKALDAENGDKFDALWNGSTDGYPSQSEADLALCGLLAFWTGGDRARIDDLFRQSGLMREKWRRDDYREQTIDKALEGRTEYYSPGDIETDDTDDSGSEGFETPSAALKSWLKDYRRENEKTPKKGKKTEAARDVLLRYDRYKTVGDDETIWRYHGDEGIWRDDGESHIRRVLDRGLGCEYSTRVLNETLDRVRAKTEINRADFTIPDGTIPVENGLLDVKTQELRPLNPEDYATYQLPAEYDEDAEAPEFQTYLEEVTRSGSDREKLQEYAGYVLMHGEMPYHKALFLTGPKASGKSTFIDIISSLLPEDVVGASTPHQLTRRFGKMELNDSWLNVSADIPSDMIENLGTFKMLVGKDRVAAEIKGVQEKVKFTPTTKHVFSANQLPEVYDADGAFWRRVLIVPFPETIPRDERVDNFDEELLEEEASGILNWMLDGYDRLVDQDGFTADRTPKETRQKWMTWSTPVIRFYARCLRDEPGASEAIDDVYAAYKDFCTEMDTMPVAKKAFGKRLTKFPHIDSTQTGGGHRNKRVYVNVRLREDLR